jgi:hypothetical protein
MLLRKTIASLSSLLLLSFLAGCGSSSNSAVAPPSGGFSKSDLSGTYVFSTTGADATTGEPLMIVGAFAANGSGSISAGNVDVAAPGLASSGQGGFASAAITSGGYSITADGRGQVNLSGTPVGKVTLDFVLQSSSHGLVTEFDGVGTGSGTIDLQNSPTVGTNYAFSLSGVTAGISPFAVAGAFTVGVGGVEDFNNGGVSTGFTDVGLTTSAVTLGTGTAPGTAQLAGTSGTFNFDVYAIDSTHFKFIENDAAVYISGDVFQQTSAQQTTLPAGTLAFTMAGLDTASNPIALGGLLPVDANGNIAAGLEDFNDAGTNVGQSTAVAGSLSALTGGRSLLTVASFENGDGTLLGTSQFAAYPSSGGILLLEVDDGGVTGGSAFVQSSTALGASQGYGLNLSAVNVASGSGGFFEEDDIAEFATTSSGFSGLIDLNDQGSTLSFDRTLDGNYAVSNGRGTASFLQGTSSSALAWFNAIFYPVDGTNFLMIEPDTTQVGTGTFVLQSTPGGSSTAIARPLFVHARPMGHLARKTKTQ